MKKLLLASAISLVGVAVPAAVPLASAAPNTKVTICHRTHAVSNPYVRITVSQNAVGSGNGKHGGNSHDQYSTVLFPGGKPTPNVFNPAVTYTPAPEKKWGDIISATDVDGNALTGGAAVVAGLNNTGIGASIFNGTGSYAGLCKTMTARDYYDLEVGEGGQNAADVLADMNEAESDEWASAKTACGGTFTGCSPATLGTPTPTTSTTAPANSGGSSNNSGGNSGSGGSSSSGNSSSSGSSGTSNSSGSKTTKVTICHRTHAVSNPYVRITVSQNSVGNGNGKHGGNSHDEYSTILFPGGKPKPNVYNPAITYSPAPEKKWGDIISATDVLGNPLTGNAAAVAGLNTSGIGAQIFTGTGAYAGYCRPMSARDFYDLEVGEGGQKPADVLADMEEAESDEWASAREACGNNFTGCAVDTLGKPTPTTTTTTNVPASTAKSSRKLRGTIWVDTNRDGKQGAKEKVLAKYAVTVVPGAGNTSGKSYAVTTDDAGNYEINGLPAGNWIVRPANLPGADYERVFDTDSGLSAPDWLSGAYVPESGEGIADFAAALTPIAVSAGTKDRLGSAPVTRRLRGTVWLDTNRDGKKGVKEKVFAKYKVSVVPGAGNKSSKSYTAYTDDQGNYEVTNLPPGKWIVRPAALPSRSIDPVFDTDSGMKSPDWESIATVPDDGDGIADFAADEVTGASASGTKLKNISDPVARKLRGTMWIDVNRDGVRGSKEKILAGYKISVRPGAGNASSKTYSITTDDAGNYEIPNIPEGNWIVAPEALSSTDYERVYDSDSGLSLADWISSVTIPGEGESVADFAADLTAKAEAAGTSDTLGTAAVRVAGSTAGDVVGAKAASGTPPTETADGTLPATGSNDLRGLMAMAMSLVLCGALLAARRRTHRI